MNNVRDLNSQEGQSGFLDPTQRLCVQCHEDDGGKQYRRFIGHGSGPGGRDHL